MHLRFVFSFFVISNSSICKYNLFYLILGHCLSKGDRGIFPTFMHQLLVNKPNRGKHFALLVRIFKSNQPVLLIAIGVIALVIWMYGFFHPIEVTIVNPMPLYKVVLRLFDNMYVVRNITGFIFLVSGAFLINYIANKHEMISKKAYLPGLLYVIISSNSIESVQLHPILISNLLVLLAVNRLYDMYKKEDTFSEVFDAGFLLAAATLLYFPCMIFCLLIFIALIIFHPFVWREWLIAIIGFFMPFAFLAVYYFLSDVPIGNLLSHSTSFALEKNTVSGNNTSFLIYLGIIAFIFLLSGASMLTRAKGIKLKTKKSTTLNYWYIAACLASILFTRFTAREMTLLATPSSIFFANYFITVKKGWWAELLFLSLATMALVNLYSPY